MKKLTIKLSHLKVWDGNYLQQSQGGLGFWDGNKFEIMNDVKECDYWVVHEGISEIETAYCSKKNCIIIIGEEKSKKDYSPKYLGQFGAVITTRNDLVHPNIIQWHYICPWHILKSYDILTTSTAILKQNNLSTVCSSETAVDGHKKRYAFINKMIGHFKDKIHIYGRGFNYIKDKYDGLSPYKYSIAIEHSVHHNYWTEKIIDCYLSLTMPVYYGCPEIHDYFPKESMILIDIDDYKKSILTIEKAIDENYYERYYDYIVHSKNLILNKYQIFPALLQILKQENYRFTNSKGTTIVKPERYFQKNFMLKRIKHKINRITGRD